jgi:regulator of RNase E activity RraA
MTFTDNEIRNLVETGDLTSSLLGDVCDAHGRYHQFLPPQLKCIDPLLTLTGRAMPVITYDVFAPQQRPFGLLTEALDQLQMGEVYIGGGGLMRNASWGELLTVTAKGRGAVGAILDGWHRDTRAVLNEQWPVFSRGSYGQDAGARSQVIDYRAPVEMGGVFIEPGNLLVGDADGVVVVPRDIEHEVIEEALDKFQKEAQVRSAIRSGVPSSQVWAQYGVL